MNTIGIRVSPSSVTFAIYDADNDAFINVDEIRVPKAFAAPEALKYVRSHLLDILREYSIKQAGIRATEPSAQTKNIERVQIEGVIQESFASSDLEKYYIGYAGSTGSRIGGARTDFKLMVDGTVDPGIDNWAEMSKEAREAMLCAKGAVNA